MHQQLSFWTILLFFFFFEPSAAVASLRQHIDLIEMNEDAALFDVVPLSVLM